MTLYKFQAENKLRISEAFNRCILGSVSAEIAVLDSSGTIIAINQAWRRFSQENRCDQDCHWQGIGSHYACLAHCESGMRFDANDVNNARAGIQAVLDDSLAHFKLEYPCRSDQMQRWFSLSVTPFGNDGQGVVVSHTNITDMDGRIEYVNPALLRNCGYSRAEVLGKKTPGRRT